MKKLTEKRDKNAKRLVYFVYLRPLPKWVERALSKMGIMSTGIPLAAFTGLLLRSAFEAWNEALEKVTPIFEGLHAALLARKDGYRRAWESVNRDMVE